MHPVVMLVAIFLGKGGYSCSNPLKFFVGENVISSKEKKDTRRSQRRVTTIKCSSEPLRVSSPNSEADMRRRDVSWVLGGVAGGCGR